MEVEMRPAKPEDFLAVCGRRNDKTVKAFTAVYRNEPVCIAGVTVEQGKCIIFSDVKPGLEAPKMLIWRTAKRLVDKIRELNIPAIATTDRGKFLASLGLECVGETGSKKIYRI